MNPQWIFFDVGWTLVDEAPALLNYYRKVVEALPDSGSRTARDLLGRHEAAVRAGVARVWESVLDEVGLPSSDWKSYGWDYGLVRPYREAGPALRALHGAVKLGVIANQGSGLPERLDHWGFRGVFDLVLGSSDCGLRKPDPALFDLAARKAGVPPDRIMMAGDRLDNDIAPAKRAGWQTAWVCRGPHGKCAPRGPEETPEVAVSNLARLAERLVDPNRLELAGLLDAAGAIAAWPRKEREKKLVLGYLAERFEPGRGYSESEVNGVIDAHHRFGDWALLRRELVDRGLLVRDDAGRTYRRPSYSE